MPTPTIITKTPVKTDFDIVEGVIALNDYYGSTGAYVATYNIPNAGVKGCFKVTAPDGTIIYNNANFSSPDVNGATATWELEVAIPANADGTLVQGTYTIVYTTQITDGTHSMYSLTNNATYDFDYTSPTISITQTVDCISPLFTTVDITDYTVDDILPSITRTMKLYYPVGSAGYASPLTTSSTTISTGTFYQNTQTTSVSSILVYTLTATGDYATFTITDTVAGTKEVVVDCTFICSSYCCIEELEERMQDAEGVNDVLFEQYSEDFTKVMGFVGLAKLAIECGKSADVAGYLTEIADITNCTSDCGCTDGTPSLVVGLGGTTITVAVASGGAPVTVTNATVGSTKTYTVTLDAAFVATVNASYNSIVTSANASVTVVTTGSNPKTYDLAVTLPTPPDKMELKCTITWAATLATSANVTISKTAVVTTGTLLQSPTIVCDDAANGNWLNLNNAFKVSGFHAGSETNTYKVLITSSRQGSTQGALRNNAGVFLCDVFGQDLVSGTFYFRFGLCQPGTPITRANSLFAGQKEELTIVISE